MNRHISRIPKIAVGRSLDDVIEKKKLVKYNGLHALAMLERATIKNKQTNKVKNITLCTLMPMTDMHCSISIKLGKTVENVRAIIAPLNFFGSASGHQKFG